MLRFEYKIISKHRKFLMGISIIGILLCHYNECRVLHGMPGNILSKILALGTAFVDVFLVLSGLGLFYSYSKNGRLLFYKKRVLRILPTYLLITLPYWIYQEVAVEGLAGIEAVKSILYNVFFGSLIFEGVQRFWFVFAILLFYIMFPLLYKGLFLFKKHDTLSFFVSIALSIFVGIILRLLFPNIYLNIKIAMDRIPVFIFGIYAGKKSVRDGYMKTIPIILLYILTFILEIFIRIDSFAFISDLVFYYTCSFLGVSILLMLCKFLEYIEKFKCGFINFGIKKIEDLGTITLEAYLLHSALKNIANYPANLIIYVLVAVVLPVLGAGLIRYILKGVVIIKKK